GRGQRSVGVRRPVQGKRSLERASRALGSPRGGAAPAAVPEGARKLPCRPAFPCSPSFHDAGAPWARDNRNLSGIRDYHDSLLGAPVSCAHVAAGVSRSQLVQKVSISCKEVTRLISEGLDRDLSLPERTQLQLHFAICRGCRAVNQQMEFLRQ